MNKNFKTPFNYNPDDYVGEVNEEPSMTVPGQSYTIEEVFTRFRAGDRLELQRDVHYGGDNFDTDEDITQSDSSFDMIDATNLLATTKANIEAKSKRLAKRKADAAASPDAQAKGGSVADDAKPSISDADAQPSLS